MTNLTFYLILLACGAAASESRREVEEERAIRSTSVLLGSNPFRAPAGSLSDLNRSSTASVDRNPPEGLFDARRILLGGGDAMEGSGGNDSSQCFDSLTRFKEGIASRDPSLLQVLDAWGKMESGTLEGNIRWLGRYKQCLSTSVLVDNGTLAERVGTRYCVATVVGNGVKSASQSISFQVGTCWPATCNSSQVSAFLSRAAASHGYNATAWCDLVSFHGWRTKDIVAATIVIIVVVMVTLSTLYDAVRRTCDTDEGIVGLYREIDEGQARPRPARRWRVLFSSLSLIRNTEQLTEARGGKGHVTCLHGVRFVSMTWIALAHSQLFSLGFIDNPFFIVRWSQRSIAEQAVVNASFAVDTFFVLSGLLVAYLGMREVEKRRGRINPLIMYLLRYLRLTPAYAFCILISNTLWLKVGGGPLFVYIGKYLSRSCDRYWWTNLLYINNMYPSSMDDECYAWGWYLANDMQYYLLTPVLLYALYKVPCIAKWIILNLIVANVILVGIVTGITEQQPSAIQLLSAFNKSSEMTDTMATNSSSAGNEVVYSDFFKDTYTKPYYRIASYLVGFAAGYFLHVNRGNEIKIPRALVLIGWLVSTCAAGLIIFGLFPYFRLNQTASVPLSAFYTALSRPVWSAVVAWVVVACASGNGGFVNEVLSCRSLIPLSRLTYSSYLVHPLIIYLTYNSVEDSLHMDKLHMTLYFVGQLFFTFLSAYILAVTVELPCANLVQICTEKWRGQHLTEKCTATQATDNPECGDEDDDRQK